MSEKDATQMAKPDGDNTPEEHRGLREPWKPGQSGNPAGRPTGARNKLSEAFWADLYEAWQANGVDAIERMIADKPGDFVRVVATQMPKELNVTNDPLSDLTDDELAELIAFVKATIAATKEAGSETEEPTTH